MVCESYRHILFFLLNLTRKNISRNAVAHIWAPFIPQFLNQKFPIQILYYRITQWGFLWPTFNKLWYSLAIFLFPPFLFIHLHRQCHFSFCHNIFLLHLNTSCQTFTTLNKKKLNEQPIFIYQYKIPIIIPRKQSWKTPYSWTTHS